MVNSYRNFYQSSIENLPNESTQQEGKSSAVPIFWKTTKGIEAAEISHSTITVRAEDFLLYYLAHRF